MKLDWEIKAENHLNDTFDYYNSLQNAVGKAYVLSVLFESFTGKSVLESLSALFTGGEDNDRI